jgi:hypothetical protein
MYFLFLKKENTITKKDKDINKNETNLPMV